MDLFELLRSHLPGFVNEKLDCNRYGLIDFIQFASNNTVDAACVLDAGAGDCPYRPLFAHTNYISTDFCKVNVPGKHYGKIDVISDLSALPFQRSSFDAILCTQVLEHVRVPQVVLDEFLRVLKEDGSLFLSVPQADPEHEVPYDYFRFTSYGLQYLLRQTGFEIVFIRPRGGYFWFIGGILKRIPVFLFPPSSSWPRKVIRYPIKFLFQCTCEIFAPLLCFYLDRIDNQKAQTIGYSCFCRKPKATPTEQQYVVMGSRKL